MSFVRSFSIEKSLRRSWIPFRIRRSIPQTSRLARCHIHREAPSKQNTFILPLSTYFERNQELEKREKFPFGTEKNWSWFSWLKVVLPLALFVIGASLSKKHLVQTTQQNWILHGCYASSSVKVTPTTFSWTDVVQYRFQKILSQQMFGKLCAVLLAATPIVILGGISYKLATGQNLSDALFKAYTIMTDLPGADMVDEQHTVATIICNVIFFSGMFTVAVTLGIICDDISNTVAEVRNGNYQIVEKDHTVILNVNKRLGAVLRQIHAASDERGSFSCPIVILADMDHEELSQMVGQENEGLNLSITTRSGCSHDLMDLRRVAIGRAKCVIWLEPEEDDEISVAARRAAAIASIKTLGAGKTTPARIVVQTSEDSVQSKLCLTNVPLAYRSPPPNSSQHLQVVEMYEETNLDRLLAQCALQPELVGIISDVFQHNDGKEFYIIEKHKFAGEFYSKARRHFNTAVVCGVYRSDSSSPFGTGEVHLNPPEDYVLHTDDSLVVLCSSLWKASPLANELPKSDPWTEKTKRNHARCSAEHIVVLCFGKEGYADSGVIDALGMFAPKGTKVTVVASSHVDKQKTNGNCQLQYIHGSPSSFRTLESLKSHKVDSIVLAGLEDLPARVADAQFVSSLIQIQEVANVYWEDKTGFSVVGSVKDVKTEQVIKHLISEGRTLPVPIDAAVILPTELSSGILVQVAGYPKLDQVFKDLLDDAGSELYIRTAEEFGLVGRGPIKISAVSDVVRHHNETFLGILRDSETFDVAPDATTDHEFTESEKLVVLAESFNPRKMKNSQLKKPARR
eukprot:g5417.t1